MSIIMANADGAVQKKKAKKKSLEEAEATEDAGDAKAQRKAAKRAAKEAALEATLEEEPAATKKKNKKNKEKVEVEVASPKKKAKRDALELAAEDEEDEAAVVTKKKKNKQEKQLEEDEDGEDEEGDEDLDPEEAKARKKARRKEAKRRRQMEKFSEEDLKKRADIKANNEAKNKQLKGKGKPTKKELYLAKKAELKAKKNAAAVSNSSETKPNVKVDPRQVECFLTGLPFLATEKHIAEHFACVGVCSVDILRHADTGKAKGTAFIRFQTAEEAARAVEYGQGSTIQSRWINVRLCEVRNDGRAPPPAVGALGAPPDGCLSIVVSKLALSVTEDDLWAFFEDCKPSTISCLMNKETGDFRGIAFVDFEDTKAVAKAGKKNGQFVAGKACFIRYKEEKAADTKETPAAKQKETKDAAWGSGNRIAAHNRAPPVPKPCGKRQALDSDSDEE
eukprot:TRINITY_DN3203_c0_g1_i5.p1 TRINITY_DN3203_c0_g1~~TRINITY_DN3203_c0_g1_i5.p1  ORF type:complete len:450 (-),score=199.56 TRINITY_DN3203_c0_g1_i5:140-1489(-)